MQIKNAKQLNEKLSEWLEKMESGKMSPMIGKEFFNGAGKMINLNKAQSDYNDRKGYKSKKVDFFEDVSD